MAWLNNVRRTIHRMTRPPGLDRGLDNAQLAQIMALLNEKSQPNLNAITALTRNLDIVALNVKALGYQLAQDLAKALPPQRNTVARHVGLGSKPSTQADIESDWVAHWCSQLKIPVIYHRKLWELAYILQVAHERGHLSKGARCLGFGVGTEPLASYFASHGMQVTMTDLAPEDARSLGWSDTQQHASSLADAYHPQLVKRERFDRLVAFRAVDMTAIPDDLVDYDLCWSTCALEHLGSIENGLAFIENSLRTLRPGGTAIHTTELNINPVGPTIDNWPTVLFQQKHFEELARRLEAAGHAVAKLDFDPGAKPLDKFVDIPPWQDGTMELLSKRLGSHGHIKVGIDGFVCTCFGITVTKAG